VTLAASSWEDLPERFALAQVYHDVARVIGWDRAIAFGMNVWREKRPPSRCHINGRGFIYIPSELGGRRGGGGSELIRLAGERDAALLVKEFPTHELEFPNIVSASIGRRNRAIVQHLSDGLRTAVVACAFGITERQVRNIASKELSACLAAKP
jgi:hypothetical protein